MPIYTKHQINNKKSNYCLMFLLIIFKLKNL